MQKAIGSDRIAATWYNGSFTVDVNLTDNAVHRVALYCLDWDNNQRAELDAATGTLLDSRRISSFGGGQYLVWDVKGHVRIVVTLTGGSNAVLSGLFFGPLE